MTYRHATTFQRNYTTKWPSMIHPQFGTLHPNFRVTGTASGRVSASEPNLQQVSQYMRPIIVARPGKVFLEFDYRQLELVVLGALSQDPEMLRAIKDAEIDHERFDREQAAYRASLLTKTPLPPPIPCSDLHRQMAARMLKIPVEQVTDKQRKTAKPVNFGIVYGETAQSLAPKLGIAEAEAQALIDSLLEAFKDAKRWIEWTQVDILKSHCVGSPLGKVRHLDVAGLAGVDDRRIQRMMGEALRKGVNAPIQGTGSYINFLGATRAAKALVFEGIAAKFLLPVHDSQLWEVDEAEVAPALEMITFCLEDTVPYPPLDTVKFKVDCEISRRWGGEFSAHSIANQLEG